MSVTVDLYLLFLFVVTRVVSNPARVGGGEGGGGGLTKLFTGTLRPEVKPLSYIVPLFTKKLPLPYTYLLSPLRAWLHIRPQPEIATGFGQQLVVPGGPMSSLCPSYFFPPSSSMFLSDDLSFCCHQGSI